MKLRKHFVSISVGLCVAVLAQSALANPFPKGDAAKGKQLHAKQCTSCHNSMFPDKDGTQLYSDMFRKVDSVPKLKGMLEYCNSQTKAGWFEEEMQHVGRYLNDNYYKFK